jgi:hypothetical protein
MNGAIIWVIRRHFSDSDRIVEPGLKDYIYNINPAVTNIIIDSYGRLNLKNIQQRPAIYCRRAIYEVHEHGISNKYLARNMGVNGENKVDSDPKYEILIKGANTVNCIGKTEAESELLATEVFLELIGFSPVLRRDLKLVKINVKSMGMTEKFEESDQHWVTPVSVKYSFGYSWSTHLDSPKFKSIKLDTTIG